MRERVWNSHRRHAFHICAASRGRGFRSSYPTLPVRSALGTKNVFGISEEENNRANDDSVHRGRSLSLGFSARHGEIGMHIWSEFKNAILPWVLAAAVVAFLIAEQHRTTAALLDANMRLANAVEQQGKALDGVRSLLASQGYTLPPLTKPQ